MSRLASGKNQKGFHLFVIVLVILVLAVAGLAAWRVASNNSKNEDGKTSTDQLATASSSSDKINKIDASKLGFDQKAAASDPIGDKNGPYYHDVNTATSTDGLRYSNGATQILNHASVPDAIKLPSGQLVVYAVDGAARSSSGILMAVSDDNGKTWKAGSMRFDASRKGGVADPQITMTDDGKLRLYYVVFPGGPDTPPGQPNTGVNKVHSALSSDGINFTQEQGTRFEYAQITDPDIIKIGNTWFMYAAQGPTQIYATSNDGSSFTYQGTARQRGSVSKTIALPGGGYRQFYCLDGISSAITTDGINWTDEGINLTPPADKIICDPSPVQVDASNWLMIYKVAAMPR